MSENETTKIYWVHSTCNRFTHIFFTTKECANQFISTFSASTAPAMTEVYVFGPKLVLEEALQKENERLRKQLEIAQLALADISCESAIVGMNRDELIRLENRITKYAYSTLKQLEEIK